MKRIAASVTVILLSHLGASYALGAEPQRVNGPRQVELHPESRVASVTPGPVGRGWLQQPPQVILPRIEGGGIHEQRLRHGGSWAGPTRDIALESDVPLDPDDPGALPGQWTTTGSGQMVWRSTVRSVGARALRLHFEGFHVNGRLYIYPNGSDVSARYVGPYTGTGPQQDGDFWSQIVFSEAATIEYVTDDPLAGSSAIPFRVTSVAHIIRLANLLRKKSDGRYPAVEPRSIVGCHLDVSCYPEWKDTQYQSTALLIISTSSGSHSCSGATINTVFDTDRHLLLLTTEHCVGSDEEAENTEFIWNYQTDSCYGQPVVGDLDRSYGSLLVKSEGPSRYDDFALLLLDLDDVLSVTGIAQLGWDARRPRTREDVVNVSHPDGAFQRIAFGDVVYQRWSDLSPLGFSTVRWRQGTTEAGSSGSAIFEMIRE